MNRFGRVFCVSIFGESHGPAVGVSVDGCPAGVPLAAEDFTSDLQRRNPTLPGTTKRKEADRPEFSSGIYQGKTTGAPLLITFANRDTRSEDYEKIKALPRPGHSDMTARLKFGGFNDPRGGGHFSGRLTAGLVAAGIVAKKLMPKIQIAARVLKAGGQADYEAAAKNAAEQGDSIGGIVECSVTGLPAGLGEPFFDSVESLISHVVFSIPGIKGIEFGDGFKLAKMTGSQANDPIMNRNGRTETNHSGGILGGITNGNELLVRVAVKPTSSISKTQKTLDLKTGKQGELKIEGRHDACIALRLPVILEAACAIVLADLLLLEQKIKRVQSD